MIAFNSVHSLMPWIIGLPLMAALLCMFVRSQPWNSAINILSAVLQLVIVSLVVMDLHHGIVAERYTLGGWGAPLGIDLAIDGLSGIMLLITAVIVLMLSIYSTQYFTEASKAARFWPLWWLLIAGLNAAFISTDAFNIYVALEMIGLSAVALVGLSGNRKALVAALRYALVGLIGSLMYLLGVVLLYRSYGTLDLSQLAALASDSGLGVASLALITVGLLLKTALFPLHFWLPHAHGSAPAPVSAALSALVVKAPFYLLLRFWLEVLPSATTMVAMNLLGLLGAAAIIWGSIGAFRAQRLKLLVAYSTVAQLGYLFLMFPLLGSTGDSVDLGNAAVSAAIYFVLAHALAKSAMFLAAGNVQQHHGHDSIDKLAGLAHTQPATVAIFAIAGISLIGLPPSGGFIAKWLLLNAAVTTGQWWWFVIMLGGGLLAAAYITRVLSIAFKQTSDEHSSVTQPSRRWLLPACGLTLALLSVLLGFNAEWILHVLIDQNAMAVVSEGIQP